MSKFKILYLDILSEDGHRNFNSNTINILDEISNIDLCFKEGYKLDLNNLNLKIDYKIPSKFFDSKNKFKSRIDKIKIINWVVNNINFKNYDLTIVASYETISFSLAWPKINSNIITINHNNLDELENNIKLYFFKRIYNNNNIKTVVFEDYFKEYINLKAGINNKIYVIKHPLNYSIKENDGGEEKKESKKIIFAPSQSNDEEFISEIIKKQIKSKFLNKINYRLVLKSKHYKYFDENLEVSNKFYDQNEYYTLFKKASYILLPYRKNFNNRLSAVFLDCILLRKKMLLKENKFFNSYLKKYKNIGKGFTDIDEFISILSQEDDNKEVESDILLEFSKKSILEKWRMVFNDE